MPIWSVLDPSEMKLPCVAQYCSPRLRRRGLDAGGQIDAIGNLLRQLLGVAFRHEDGEFIAADACGHVGQAPQGALFDHLQAVIEATPVEQSGQRIAFSEKFALILLRLECSNVLHLPKRPLYLALANEGDIVTQQDASAAQPQLSQIRTVLLDENFDAGKLGFRVVESRVDLRHLPGRVEHNHAAG